MTIAEFGAFAKEKLNKVYDVRESNNVIQLVIEELIPIPKHQLKFHLKDELDIAVRERLIQAVIRLEKDEPVQYVLGVADFYGMKLKVNRHVLIPRPETEELADYAVKSFMSLTTGKSLFILDVGTGSGCIAIALKKKLPDSKVTGIDSSKEAIKIARENTISLNCDVSFIVNDFLDESAWNDLETYDAIVSNPPYVTKEEFSEMMPRVKNFEPLMALIANDADPFIFYKKAAAFGKKHLNPGGQMFLEINSEHATEINSIFKSDSYKTSIIRDLQGRDRILVVSIC